MSVRHYEWGTRPSPCPWESVATDDTARSPVSGVWLTVKPVMGMLSPTEAGTTHYAWRVSVDREQRGEGSSATLALAQAAADAAWSRLLPGVVGTRRNAAQVVR